VGFALEFLALGVGWHYRQAKLTQTKITTALAIA
jgi:hypothetical protein